MLRNFLFTLTLLAPVAAFASTADDVARIRPLLPAGTDVAQIQAGLLTGANADEALELGAMNYLIRDITGDGLADILVIVEKNPTFVDYSGDTAKPCPAYDPAKNCMLQYGPRTLNFYVGQANGGFKLAFSNGKMVLNGDEGGVFGDPLNGLTAKTNGAITLSVYGGSSWRWGYTDVMQFRKGDLFVIGQDSEDGWTGDGRSHTVSVNLLTGQVVETTQKSGDAPVHTRRYKVAMRPLVRVADYKGQAGN